MLIFKILILFFGLIIERHLFNLNTIIIIKQKTTTNNTRLNEHKIYNWKKFNQKKNCFKKFFKFLKYNTGVNFYCKIFTKIVYFFFKKN